MASCSFFRIAFCLLLMNFSHQELQTLKYNSCFDYRSFGLPEVIGAASWDTRKSSPQGKKFEQGLTQSKTFHNANLDAENFYTRHLFITQNKLLHTCFFLTDIFTEGNFYTEQTFTQNKPLHRANLYITGKQGFRQSKHLHRAVFDKTILYKNSNTQHIYTHTHAHTHRRT